MQKTTTQTVLSHIRVIRLMLHFSKSVKVGITHITFSPSIIFDAVVIDVAARKLFKKSLSKSKASITEYCL